MWCILYLIALAFSLTAGLAVACIFLRQSGRMLLRLDAIERDLLLVRAALAPDELPRSPELLPLDPKAAAPHPAPPRGSRINRSGLLPGTTAPDFTLPLLGREGDLSLSAYQGEAVLLIFLSVDCHPCQALARRLALLSGHPAARRVLLIVRGDPEAYRREAAALGLGFPAVLQRAWEVSRMYGTFQIPSAYCIDPDRTVVSGLVVGPDAILGLACDVLAAGFHDRGYEARASGQSDARKGQSEVVA